MEKQLTGLNDLLDISLVRRVRRNHGLEHATIHLMSRRVPQLKIIGRSDARGFWLYGDVSTDIVRESANQALARMQQGEHQLAVHPNCGTNLVSVALLGTAATLVALAGSEREKFGKIQRIPLIIMGLLGAAMLGQPLGMRLQQHVTTLGDPGDLAILSIERMQRGAMTVHRVETRST
nr:hypothetical protein [Anaerolineae bacterium]